MNNVFPVDETDIYVLFKEQDEIFLFDKEANKELWRTSNYGEIRCGKIGLVNDWVIFATDLLIIWKENEFFSIHHSDLKSIVDMRQVGDNEVEILTDPWSKNSGIWSFNIETQRKKIIRKFNDYYRKPHEDNIIW